MLSTLLATKLHKPRPIPGLVARPRLTERLDVGLRNGHRLFLVVAPAGYGKTTLVADWLDKTDMASAWLSLDEADNDPLCFFTYLVAALQKTLGPKLTQPLPEAFPVTPLAPEAFIRPLINDLTAVDRPILLALDDFHLITAEPVQEIMALLLRRGPPNLHLLVLTRVDPPFPLSRLRVRERMTEIRDWDLRLTAQEMTAFLRSRHHLNLTAEQIAALESRTEGWVAAVQLAALSLQGCSAEDASEFISAFSGSHHYIVDYLFEEVLSRQPEQVRRFLLQTSILERMCAPLCEAVLSGGAKGSEGSDPGDVASPSQEILQHLERSSLFLIPLDDERRWYRYHHLFVDVLRQMHRSASPPDQIAGLHACASDWYGQNRFIADAYHHALLAGHHERAAEIVEENAWSMVLQAELGTLKKWIQALPGDSVSRRPWSCIYYAWALLFGESDAAEAQLEAVEQHLRAGDGIALQPEMQGHIAAMRAWLAYMRGDPHQAVVLSRLALEFWPQMDAAVRSGLMAIWGVGRREQSDLPGAARAFTEAIELAQTSGNIMIEVAARTSLGGVSEMLGRLREAEAIYREALQRAILLQSPVSGQAYLYLARVHREWNDLASARFLLEKSIESSRLWGTVDALVEGFLSLARIQQAHNNIPEANHLLSEVSQTMQGHLLNASTSQWIGAIRARLWLVQGKLDDARHWAETRGLSAGGELDLSNEVEYLTLVRILLAEHNVDDAARLLSRLQMAAESTGRQGDLIAVLVLQAVVSYMQTDTSSALAVLEHAVRLAHAEGYTRVFLDEGKPMESLLKMATTKWRDHDHLAYARKLLAAFAAEGSSPAAARAPEPAILSERELQVLRLMAAGRTNQEIANELVIAIGTAKRHTANIFDKLDVRNRTEAVAIARQLNLL